MTTQLYIVPLPDSQAQSADEGVAANIDVQGLLEEGGVATQKIAAENIDLTISGQFRLGPTFAHKLARELESLGQSTYSGLALYDPTMPDFGPNSGYFEISSVDVNPAHPTTQDAYEFTVALETTGTIESHWRAVETNPVTIGTGLAGSGDSLLGVPSDDLKERWYQDGVGSEVATATSTVSAEFGDIDLFDPANSSFDSPALLFEQPYDAEGSVDVRVWDDRGEDKYASFDDGDGGTVEITQWTHAFHTGFEFEGAPLIDNGLLRLRFDEPNGVIEAWEWDDGSSAWSSISITHGDWALFDADLEREGPSAVQVYSEWENATDGSISAARLSIQRGLSDVIVRNPQNDTIPSGLESVFSPIASDQSSDLQPTQTVLSRSEVK